MAQPFLSFLKLSRLFVWILLASNGRLFAPMDDFSSGLLVTVGMAAAAPRYCASRRLLWGRGACAASCSRPGEAGAGKQNAGDEAPVGRRLRAGDGGLSGRVGVFSLCCVSTWKGCAASFIGLPKHGGPHASADLELQARGKNLSGMAEANRQSVCKSIAASMATSKGLLKKPLMACL
jgi:hypothetical protein